MNGGRRPRMPSADLRKALTSSPYRLAASLMYSALLPSRETPQSSRSTSSGTYRPWNSRMIPSAAAPHSAASIWRTVGVRTRRHFLLGLEPAMPPHLDSGKIRGNDDPLAPVSSDKRGD